MIASDLLTEEAAAKRLAIKIKTLQKWRVTGDGPRYVKVGRSVRYRVEELEAFI
jgi:hypothetical protein